MKKTYLSHNKKKNNLADWPEMSLERNEGKKDLDLSQADFYTGDFFVLYFLLFHPSFVFFAFFCSKVNFNREFRSNWRCLREKKTPAN